MYCGGDIKPGVVVGDISEILMTTDVDLLDYYGDLIEYCLI